MNKQDAQQLMLWINRIAEYVPPVLMREGQHLVALKVLEMVAKDEITLKAQPCP